MESELKYFKPQNIPEAEDIAKNLRCNFRYIAGGTDIMVNKHQGNENYSALIDLTGIDELRKMSEGEEFLSIGSLVDLEELANNPFISEYFPVLCKAAKSVGSPLIRKWATIGGNLLCENRCIYYNQSEWWRKSVGYCLKCEGSICIATGSKKYCYSEFVSDTAPALISIDAMIDIVDNGSSRIVPLEDIYTGDGKRPRNLRESALIKAILLPLNDGYKSVFKKLRIRKSLDFTSLTTAVSMNSRGKLKIAAGGVDPKPVVVEGTIESDKEEMIAKVLSKSRAINNEMLSRKYRRDMIRTFLSESFEDLGIS